MNKSTSLYKTRDEEVKAAITEEEAIRRIEEIYQAQYDSANQNFSIWDQLLACEAVEEATPISDTYYNKFNNLNENGSVKGSDNGSYKRRANFELSDDQLRAISTLGEYSLSSPIEFEEQLAIVFNKYPSNPGHWLYIAQHHTLRQINWSINYTLMLNKSGRIRKNPAACFTNDIKYRERKKDIRRQKKKRDL